MAVGAVPAQAAAATATPSSAASESSVRVGPYLHDHPTISKPTPRKAAKVSVAAPAAKPGHEITDLRTATTRTYATDTPGEFETKAYTQPVNYRDAKGAWKDIDTSLVKGSDGSYTSSRNAFTVKVAGSATAGSLTDVDLGGGQGLSWSLGSAHHTNAPATAGKAATTSNAANPSASSAAANPSASTAGGSAAPSAPSAVTASVKDSTATFAGALPGASVKVAATATGVKENLVLARVYEIKPNNIRAIRAGQRQAFRYMQELQRMYNTGEWQWKVITYN